MMNTHYTNHIILDKGCFQISCHFQGREAHLKANTKKIDLVIHYFTLFSDIYISVWITSHS